MVKKRTKNERKRRSAGNFISARFHFSKRFGQHFLLDKAILKRIIQVADIQPTDRVVEIGAGSGNLTILLAQTGAQILALEKDRHLIPYLQRRLKGAKNVQIVQQDARFFDYQSLGRYKLVANLPYNITSFLLRKILTSKSKPSPSGSGVKELVLMVQKEVAEKLVAPPGDSRRSVLTSLLELVGRVELVMFIPKESFYPAPKVESALIKIHPVRHWNKEDENLLRFIKLGFSHKRRQLANNLISGSVSTKQEVYAIMKKIGLNPHCRAENLTIQEWKELYANYFKKSRSASASTLAGKKNYLA